jgi:hypothetical protein
MQSRSLERPSYEVRTLLTNNFRIRLDDLRQLDAVLGETLRRFSPEHTRRYAVTRNDDVKVVYQSTEDLQREANTRRRRLRELVIQVRGSDIELDIAFARDFGCFVACATLDADAGALLMDEIRGAVDRVSRGIYVDWFLVLPILLAMLFPLTLYILVRHDRDRVSTLAQTRLEDYQQDTSVLQREIQALIGELQGTYAVNSELSFSESILPPADGSTAADERLRLAGKRLDEIEGKLAGDDTDALLRWYIDETIVGPLREEVATLSVDVPTLKRIEALQAQLPPQPVSPEDASWRGWLRKGYVQLFIVLIELIIVYLIFISWRSSPRRCVFLIGQEATEVARRTTFLLSVVLAVVISWLFLLLGLVIG